MKEQITALERLVAQYDALAAEAKKLKEMEEQLKEERYSIIRSGRVEDRDSIVRATNISTTLQMIPYRLEELEKKGKDLSEKLYDPTNRLRGAIEDAAAERQNKALSILTKLLRDVESREHRAGDLAAKVFPMTRFNEEISPFYQANLLVGGGSPVIDQSKLLLEKAKSFQALPAL